MGGAPAARAGIHRWLFARLLEWGARRHEPELGPRKRALFAPLRGDVLEIGPGTGVNFAHLPDGVRWIGVEPNVHMEPYLRRAAAARGVAAEVRRGVAERLPAGDASVDAVVATHVLCSVDDPARVLAEVRRVLRPGGRFVFLEHVAAPRGTWLRAAQRLARPLWRVCADGCHPDRETWAAIERAGFARVAYERFTLRAPLVGPHVAGHALAP